MIDSYSSCPCGSGKKIKWCCSKDLVHELDQVTKSVHGEQRVAALSTLETLLKKHGNRPALLALKSTVQLQLGEVERAEETVATLLEAVEANPVGLANRAIIDAVQDRTQEAIAGLQRALAAVTEEMPLQVYETLHVLGRVLFSQGKLLAARGHLMLHSSIGSQHEDKRSLELMLRLINAPQAPLLLKQEWNFATPPADAAWAPQFEEAMEPVGRGVWSEAVKRLDELERQRPNEPCILKNRAILYGWLDDSQGAVRNWHAFARCPMPLDDAVEAEALAQLLDPDTHKAKVQELTITYGVSDMDGLMERLLSDRCLSRIPVDPVELAQDEQPPPKAVFWLLDRELPTSSEDLKRGDVPTVLGEIHLYGRQTDRPARLEFLVTQTPDFQMKIDQLARVMGTCGGGEEQREVTGEIPAESALLAWNWRLPDDTSRELRDRLVNEQREEVIFQRWTAVPLSVLQGNTPREAAADPQYRVPLLAAILRLELSAAESHWELDFDRLRRELGLPVPEPIDLASEVASEDTVVTLARLNRLVAETLSDDALLEWFRTAVMAGVTKAIERLGTEVIRRPSCDYKMAKPDVYRLLAENTADSAKALTYLQQGCSLDVERGNSPAPWLLAEIPFRVQRGEREEFQRLVLELQTRHHREPGVARALYEMLVSLGMIHPEDAAVGATPEAAVASTEQAAPASQLWTPDRDPAQQEKGTGKSNLYLPGMD